MEIFTLKRLSEVGSCILLAYAAYYVCVRGCVFMTIKMTTTNCQLLEEFELEDECHDD